MSKSDRVLEILVVNHGKWVTVDHLVKTLNLTMPEVRGAIANLSRMEGVEKGGENGKITRVRITGTPEEMNDMLWQIERSKYRITDDVMERAVSVLPYGGYASMMDVSAELGLSLTQLSRIYGRSDNIECIHYKGRHYFRRKEAT